MSSRVGGAEMRRWGLLKAGGAWPVKLVIRRSMSGAMYARAWVVLLGMSVPLLWWRASVVASTSIRLSRISCSKCAMNCGAPGGDEPAILSMTKGAGCEIPCGSCRIGRRVGTN